MRTLLGKKNPLVGKKGKKRSYLSKLLNRNRHYIHRKLEVNNN